MRYCLLHAQAWVPDAATGWSHSVKRPSVLGHWEAFPLEMFVYARAFGQAFGCAEPLVLALGPCNLCCEERTYPERGRGAHVDHWQYDAPTR